MMMMGMRTSSVMKKRRKTKVTATDKEQNAKA